MKNWLGYVGRLFVLYTVTAAAFALIAFLAITAAAFPLQSAAFVSGLASGALCGTVAWVYRADIRRSYARLRASTFRDVISDIDHMIARFIGGHEHA